MAPRKLDTSDVGPLDRSFLRYALAAFMVASVALLPGCPDNSTVQSTANRDVSDVGASDPTDIGLDADAENPHQFDAEPEPVEPSDAPQLPQDAERPAEYAEPVSSPDESEEPVIRTIRSEPSLSDSDATPYDPGPDDVPLSEQEELDTTSSDPRFKVSSDLKLVSDRTKFPWRTTAKLTIKALKPDGSAAKDHSCTGAFIDARHVLTSGHCVFVHQDKERRPGWVQQIIAKPAYDGTLPSDERKPYGEATSTQFHSLKGYTEHEDEESDIALVDLARPVGAVTGWLGFGFNDDCDFFEQKTFSQPGYPGEGKYDGKQMWSWKGNIDDCEDRRLIFEGVQSVGGQSGSALIGPKNVAYGALKGHSDDENETRTTRITQDRYHLIQGWIADDIFDKLRLYALDVQIDPKAVKRGTRLKRFSYLIHNQSNATIKKQTFDVEVYLSENDSISTGDLRVQTHQVTVSLGELERVRINLRTPPKIPSDVKARSYFLGVRILKGTASGAAVTTSKEDVRKLKVTSK